MNLKKQKRKKNENEQINKSKEIIKKEKIKIKEEKKKQKIIKQKAFYNTKLGRFLKKAFLINDENYNEPISIKKQIFSMLYFELLGSIICLIILFVISGGKNYIKLYYELSKFIDVYDVITSDYYSDIDKNELIDKSIQSLMTATGDNYTVYTNEDDTNSFLENINGTYEGIGCTVAMDNNGNIIVVSIFSDSPAMNAGLKENDIIVKIDDVDYSNKTSEDMSKYVKNNKNKKIKLTIIRDNQEKNITIERKKVEVPSVTSEVIEEGDVKIGYIDISIFSAVTYEQFKENLEKLESKNIQSLIIDVRDDTGGYLSAVTDIASLFLKKGKVIYQLQSDKNINKIKDKTSEKRDYPIAVLINSASASASEILASAIKESYGGFVVGVNSYGKGTVQKTKQLSDGSMIKYTIQKWLTPKSNWINDTGVEPTNYVEYEKQSEDVRDSQLQKAIELVIEKCKK